MFQFLGPQATHFTGSEVIARGIMPFHPLNPLPQSKNTPSRQDPIDKSNSLVDASRCPKKTIRVTIWAYRESEKWPSNYKRGISRLKTCISEYHSIYSQPPKTKINITKLKRGNKKNHDDFSLNMEFLNFKISGGFRWKARSPFHQTQVPKKSGSGGLQFFCQNRNEKKKRCSIQKSKFGKILYIYIASDFFFTIFCNKLRDPSYQMGQLAIFMLWLLEKRITKKANPNVSWTPFLVEQLLPQSERSLKTYKHLIFSRLV